MTPTYNLKSAIRAGLVECRDELEVPAEVCATDPLLDHVLEATSLSAPQCLVLGVFLTMHAQTAIEQAQPAPDPEKEGDLVGRTVEAVAVSRHDDYVSTLYLRCSDGHVLSLPTDGDCCSTTWWNDVIAPKQLIGARVTAIESISLPDPDCTDVHDVLQDYGVKITTDRGVCTLVYRNSSNGYYGGSHWATWVSDVPAGVTYITEDWSA